MIPYCWFFYTMGLFSFAGSHSTCFIAPAMFCSLNLCTGSSQHPCAGHPQISPTTTRHVSLSPSWNIPQSHLKNKHQLSFLHHTVPSSQSSMLKEETWCSPWFFSPSHSHPTCSKSEISLSYPHSALWQWTNPIQDNFIDCLSDISCLFTAPIVIFFNGFILLPQSFMSSHFPCNPNFIPWHIGIFTVPSPPSQTHFTVYPWLTRLQSHLSSSSHTKCFPSSGNLHMPTLLPENYSPWSFLVSFFPSLVSAWILLSDYYIQSMPL